MVNSFLKNVGMLVGLHIWRTIGGAAYKWLEITTYKSTTSALVASSAFQQSPFKWLLAKLAFRSIESKIFWKNIWITTIQFNSNMIFSLSSGEKCLDLVVSSMNLYKISWNICFWSRIKSFSRSFILKMTPFSGWSVAPYFMFLM